MKCLKADSSIKTKKITKYFQRKNIIFFYALFEYIYRSWLFDSYNKYQLNSQSMGRLDKRKAVYCRNL